MAIDHIEIWGDDGDDDSKDMNNKKGDDNSDQPEEDKSDKTNRRRTNYITDIQEYLQENYQMRFNTLTLTLEFKRNDEHIFKTLDERVLNTIWIDLQLEGLKCSDKTLDKILRSEYTKSYHPLHEYFKGLPKHDGTDYIGELAATIEITDLQAGELKLKKLWRTYLEKWLVASVATCIGKGINQTCLILVGGQGSGKTTWLNKLTPVSMKSFAVCGHINPSMTDNHTVNLLAEKWLVNIDDQLENIFYKDFNAIKAIITTPFVTNRKAFARLTKTRSRTCSFMGSVNNPQFLTDTSNRRYLVFSTEKIDFKHTIPIQKVWAQALHLLQQGFSYWFTDPEIAQLNIMNEHFQTATVEQEWLIKIFEPCDLDNKSGMYLMSSEILSILGAHSGLKLNQKKLSQAFEKLGYGKPIAKRINGKGVRRVFYVRKITDEQENKFQRDARKDISAKKDDNKGSDTTDPPNLFTE
ncbi:VapE domain-containing protein [Aquimarina sediminis]|uniref:VapE domain-containing protein n=1 Tax=Aquimarina sediminis TaxID=2070536 RepID=UPI000CA00E8A|nr:VapE domain-containing protein [Aquimarina sediminis]